jgi:hypothetical protein
MATATTTTRYQVGAPVLGNPTSVQETTELRQRAEIECASENMLRSVLAPYFPVDEAAAAQTHVAAGTLVRRTQITSDSRSVVVPRAIPHMSMSMEAWTGHYPVTLSRVIEMLIPDVDSRNLRELAEKLFIPFLKDESVNILDDVRAEMRGWTTGPLLANWLGAFAGGADLQTAAAAIAGGAAASNELTMAVAFLAAAQQRQVTIAAQGINGETVNGELRRWECPFVNPSIREAELKQACLDAHSQLFSDIGDVSVLERVKASLVGLNDRATVRFLDAMEEMRKIVRVGLTQIANHCRSNIGQYDYITACILLTSDNGVGMVSKYASAGVVATLMGYLVPRLTIIMDVIRNPFSGVVYTDHEDGDDHKVAVATSGQIAVLNIACRRVVPGETVFALPSIAADLPDDKQESCVFWNVLPRYYQRGIATDASPDNGQLSEKSGTGTMNPLVAVPRAQFDVLTAGFDALLGDASLSIETEVSTRIGTVNSVYSGERRGVHPDVSVAPMQVLLG